MSDNLTPEERDQKIIHCMEVIEDCQRDMDATRSRFVISMVFALIAVTVSICATFTYSWNVIFIVIDVLAVTVAGVVIVTNCSQLRFMRSEKEAHEERLAKLQQAR